MSHELETFANGETAFVSAREDAWHRLGTVLDHTFTAEEALQHAHLAGWDVRKVALRTQVMKGSKGKFTSLDVPNSYATIRTNPVTGEPEVLGTVGGQYTPIQNEDHCELLNTLVDQSGAHFETAGSLKGGKEVFVTMKMPETITIGGIDETEINIAALNSHDGTSSFRFLVTPVRIVCANTQAAAIRSARSTFNVRHTANSRNVIAEAREALGLTFKFVDAFQTEAEKMIQQSMTEAAFFEIVNKIWVPSEKDSPRAKNVAAERTAALGQLFLESSTTREIRGTRYAAYNAFTEYVDHFAPVNLGKNAATEADARALRTLTSKGANDIKTEAFQLLSV